jgi:hypothetical protein
MSDLRFALLYKLEEKTDPKYVRGREWENGAEISERENKHWQILI